MTPINNSPNIDPVQGGSRIPSVALTYNPPVVLPGGQVQVGLEVDGKFAPNTVLKVDLASEDEEVLLSASIVFPGLTADLAIPCDFDEGTYRLQVIYKNSVLDSTFLDVVKDKVYVQQMEDFAKGLSIEDQVAKAVKKGNYEEVFVLQEQVEQLYRSASNLELAARSWEDLGEALFEKEQPKLSKKALVKALSIYSGVQELEDNQPIIDRIHKTIEICQNFISKSTPFKSVDFLKKIEISAESIAQKIFESTQRLKEAKLRKEKTTRERQQFEIEEQRLNLEINELESCLKNTHFFM